MALRLIKRGKKEKEAFSIAWDGWFCHSDRPKIWASIKDFYRNLFSKLPSYTIY